MFGYKITRCTTIQHKFELLKIDPSFETDQGSIFNNTCTTITIPKTA